MSFVCSTFLCHTLLGVCFLSVCMMICVVWSCGVAGEGVAGGSCGVVVMVLFYVHIIYIYNAFILLDSCRVHPNTSSCDLPLCNHDTVTTPLSYTLLPLLHISLVLSFSSYLTRLLPTLRAKAITPINFPFIVGSTNSTTCWSGWACICWVSGKEGNFI